jgi:tRNA threonylcarbamoyladenosine biosynthesis protein TsaB
MSLILNIDTSVETASVCLAQDGNPIQTARNDKQKDHASWLHAAIAGLLEETGYAIKELEAVAVTIGPGSYTGLRIGLSTAKGICYTKGIPLITIGTLRVMAYAARDEKTDLICPMIDARRMEVFTALYNKQEEQLIPPQALVLTENSFQEFLEKKTISFIGNGSAKFKALTGHKNAFFSDIKADASDLAQLSITQFHNKEFSDLVYIEPLYIKNFYSLHTV